MSLCFLTMKISQYVCENIELMQLRQVKVNRNKLK